MFSSSKGFLTSVKYYYRETIELNGPRREETCLREFRQIGFQTSLLSYRDQLENLNFASNKFTYNTFQKANNKGTDQTARMRRLVCACVVCKPPKTGFLASRPILTCYDITKTMNLKLIDSETRRKPLVEP